MENDLHAVIDGDRNITTVEQAQQAYDALSYEAYQKGELLDLELSLSAMVGFILKGMGYKREVVDV